MYKVHFATPALTVLMRIVDRDRKMGSNSDNASTETDEIFDYPKFTNRNMPSTSSSTGLLLLDGRARHIGKMK